MLLSSDYVPLNGERKCPHGQLGTVVVFRAIPSSRAMALRDNPFSLAFQIAFHRTSWVGVGVRFHGSEAVLAVSFAAVFFPATVWTVSSAGRTDFRAARCRCWDLPMWWSPTLLTIRLSSVPGDQAETPAHRAPILGGGSWVARDGLRT